MCYLLQSYTCLILILGNVQTAPKDRFKTITTPIPIKVKSNGCPKIPKITIDVAFAMDAMPDLGDLFVDASDSRL